MKAPKEIFIWNCEGRLSRSYYKEEGKAFKACVRRFRLPQCFGLPRYVKDSNEVLLDEIKAKLDRAKTDECKQNAKAGLYNDQQVLDFVEQLKKIVNS